MNTHSNLNNNIISVHNDNFDRKRNIKEILEYKEDSETNASESNNSFKRGKKIDTNAITGNSFNTKFKPNTNYTLSFNNPNTNNTTNNNLNTISILDDTKIKLEQNNKTVTENKCCTPSNSNISNTLINNIANNDIKITPNTPYVLNSDVSKLVEEDIFDSLNQDELMDILNQNICYFEDDQVPNLLDPVGQIKMTPRLSTSKKKVYRQGPASHSEPQITQDNNGNNNNNNIAPNNLFNQFTEFTPLKSSTGVKEEIKSEIIVKKLLELKERAQLEHLLEKYNLKMCFDSQTNVEENVKKEKEMHEVEENNSKRIECPICFDSIQK